MRDIEKETAEPLSDESPGKKAGLFTKLCYQNLKRDKGGNSMQKRKLLVLVSAVFLICSCAGAQIFPTAESEFEKGLALFNA
jgi:hypothetical protein